VIFSLRNQKGVSVQSLDAIRMPKSERKDKRDRGEARRWSRRLKILLRSHVPRLGRRTPMPSLSNGTESPLFEYIASHSPRVDLKFELIL